MEVPSRDQLHQPLTNLPKGQEQLMTPSPNSPKIWGTVLVESIGTL